MMLSIAPRPSNMGNPPGSSLSIQSSDGSYGSNPQTSNKSASPSTRSTGSKGSTGSSSNPSDLPPLFYFMELGQWEKAIDRVKRHPRDAKAFATIRTFSQTEISPNTGKPRVSSSKRLALHHACFKLRNAGAHPMDPDLSSLEDPFVQICRLILLLVKSYPEGAGQRETRHGCLPIHLAAFASCAPKDSAPAARQPTHSPTSQGSSFWKPNAVQRASSGPNSSTGSNLARPSAMSSRVASDATAATTETHLSEIHAQEALTGGVMLYNAHNAHKDPFLLRGSACPNSKQVAVKNAIVISAKREELAVQVVNALLDAYPKGIRVDSEGGRLPLHTACAGRATPRVISTLVTAYPSAARHRNKDGFLPLHLAAHWGVSHPNVCITLLKCYPDATVGRNRWERTPLEEALCMAGENGRPHQAALVRALRKHPSYWSRPSDILDHASKNTRRGQGPTTLDMDASLPSFEDTATLSERNSYYGHEPDQKIELELNSNAFNGKLPPMLTRGKVPHDDPNVPLPKLILQGHWEAVLLRLETNPLQAELELEVTTRGGFMACTGFTPLHYACERQPPLEVVQALIAKHPVGVLTRAMPGGALPLHIACTWHASIEVVKALLSVEPTACQIADELGNVALHAACFSGAELGMVEVLTAVDPQAVLIRNHQGSRPSDVSKRLRHYNRKSILALLTLKKEEVLAMHRRKTSSGLLGDVARKAAHLNEQEDNQVDDETAIEVSLSPDAKADDMMWV